MVANTAGRPRPPPETEVVDENDTICAVCFDGVSTDENQIVFCDRCDVALHQVRCRCSA